MADNVTRLHAEPLTPWETIRQAFAEGVHRGKARSQRRQALRREARALSTPAMEELLNSVEHDMITLLETRHDPAQRVVSTDEVSQLMADWQTVRRDLERRERRR